ncbi:hypothetical protein DFH11DRAFT_1619807 [Phellopilus nigrolimitatus]|nr:hypothetical protein DFH11DRAFT_1619807 [Phellopilus nigrolimitatus]
MGLKKDWVYDSTVPPSLAEELCAEGFSRPVSSHFERKRAALESYSLSASGDLEFGSAFDWPRLSVASRAHELKKRMKKTYTRGRYTNSITTSYFEESPGKVFDFGGAGDVGLSGITNSGENKVPKLAQAPSLTPKPCIPDVKQELDPFAIDTVADLLLVLKKLGRPSPTLTPAPSGPSHIDIPLPSSFPAPSESELSQAMGSDNDGYDSETDDDSTASAVLQTPVESENEASGEESRIQINGDPRRTQDKVGTKDVQNLITFFPSSPLAKSSPNSTLPKQILAISDARVESLRAFAAYHTERERLLDFEIEMDGSESAAMPEGESSSSSIF